LLRSWKYWISTQNPKGIAFGFKKMFVHVKTSKKSAFHPCEVHILALLDIVMLYTIFFRFWKISSFALKPNRVIIWFYQKTSVHDKNDLEIHILFPWGTYSFLVRHFGVVHKFLGFQKISSFGSKPKWVSIWFYQQISIHIENGPNKGVFRPHEAHILARLNIMLLYINF
jgi:hypothetical protein